MPSIKKPEALIIAEELLTGTPLPLHKEAAQELTRLLGVIHSLEMLALEMSSEISGLRRSYADVLEELARISPNDTPSSSRVAPSEPARDVILAKDISVEGPLLLIPKGASLSKVLADAARFRWLQKGLPHTVILDSKKPNGACIVRAPVPEPEYGNNLARAIDESLRAWVPGC